MDAIILCGGKGTRLATVVSDVPKPMAPIHGRPFLDYLIAYVQRSGLVSRLTFATGYMGEKVSAHYADLGARFCQESAPLGTGGAIMNVLRSLDVSDPFIVMNGDSFIDADLAELHRRHQANARAASIALFNIADSARFGTVTLDGERIIRFEEKSGRPVPGLINSGIYLLSHRVLQPWLDQPRAISIETEVFPSLTAAGSLYGFATGQRFIDIGLPETYAAASSFFGHLDQAGHLDQGNTDARA